VKKKEEEQSPPRARREAGAPRGACPCRNFWRPNSVSWPSNWNVMFKVLEFVLALITHQIAGPKPTLFRHDLLQLHSSEERVMVVERSCRGAGCFPTAKESRARVAPGL